MASYMSYMYPMYPLLASCIVNSLLFIRINILQQHYVRRD